MNTKLLHIVKQIIADNGEGILSDPARVKAFFSDLAKDEPKPLRMAFGRGLEAGAYTALKTAPDAGERALRKTTIARRLRDEHGLDPALSAEALDILEAALFGNEQPPVLCKSCGKALQEDWKMCPHCGTASPALPSPQPVPPPEQPPPAAPAVSVQQLASVPVTQSQAQIRNGILTYIKVRDGSVPATKSQAQIPPPKKKHTLRNVLIAAAGAAAVAAAAIAVVWNMSANTAPPPDMVKIPGGTFTMGSPANERERGNDEVQHQVTVSGFSMGNYEVTQREWREVMGNNPSHFKGDNLPVENVSWYEAVEYCNRLSQREGLTPAYTINGTNVSWNRNANGYRLPTEAEWEYACRAGTTTPFNTGNNITTSQANYNGNFLYNNNAKWTYREKTVEVGSFAANGWGLYDMHGNVWEWCWDWGGYYTSGSQNDPIGPSTGAYRVCRGGSWIYGAQYVRSAYRSYNGPSYRDSFVGFRLVRP